MANDMWPRVMWPMVRCRGLNGQCLRGRRFLAGGIWSYGSRVEGNLAREIWSYGSCRQGFFGRGDMELCVMWSRVLWPGRYGAIGHVVEGSLAREIWSYGSCGQGFFGQGDMEL